MHRNINGTVSSPARDQPSECNDFLNGPRYGSTKPKDCAASGIPSEDLDDVRLERRSAPDWADSDTETNSVEINPTETVKEDNTFRRSQIQQLLELFYDKLEPILEREKRIKRGASHRESVYHNENDHDYDNSGNNDGGGDDDDDDNDDDSPIHLARYVRGRKRYVRTYRRLFYDPRGSKFIRGPAFTGVSRELVDEYNSFKWSRMFIERVDHPNYAHLIVPFPQHCLVHGHNLNIFLDQGGNNRPRYLVPHKPKTRFKKTPSYESKLFNVPTLASVSAPDSQPRRPSSPLDATAKDDVNFECCFERPMGTVHNYYAIDDEKHTYLSYVNQLAGKVRIGGSRTTLWYRVEWTQLEVDQRIAFLVFCDHLLTCGCRQIQYHVCPDRDDPDDHPDDQFPRVGQELGEPIDSNSSSSNNSNSSSSSSSNSSSSDNLAPDDDYVLYGTLISSLDHVPLHPAQSRYVYFACRTNPRNNCTCPPDDTRVNSLTVTGPPGCGKTHLVKFLSTFNPCPVLPSNVSPPRLIYLAPTNALKRATAAATGSNNSVQCQTICQYFMQMFNLNFFDFVKLQSIMIQTGLCTLFKNLAPHYRLFMAQNEFHQSPQYDDQDTHHFPPEAYTDPAWRRSRRTVHSSPPPSPSDDMSTPDKHSTSCRGNISSKVVFIDEITMSAPQLLCVIRMMTAVLLPFNSRLIIVWLGDPDQLLPIYANTLQYDAIQLPLDDKASLRYLAQVPRTQQEIQNDEDAASEVQLHRGQNIRLLICKRSRDRRFVRFISLCRDLWSADDVIEAIARFLDELNPSGNDGDHRDQGSIMDNDVGYINTPLTYRYPIEAIVNVCTRENLTLQALDKYSDIPTEFEPNDSQIKSPLMDLVNVVLSHRFHETILTDLVVTYRNRDVHYCDLSLANVVANQVEQFLANASPESSNSTPSTFTTPEDASRHDSPHPTLNHFIMYHVVGLEESDTVVYDSVGNYYLHLVPSLMLDIPIIPLVRFMPYFYVGTQQRNLSGLRLILLAGTRTQLYFLAHEPDNRFSVQRVLMEHFNWKLFKGQTSLKFDVYGFPVKLAFGHTFHSSQGLTLTQDVTIVMHDISLRALYVAITRAREFRQIRRFVVPENLRQQIMAKLRQRQEYIKVHRSNCKAGGGGNTNNDGSIIFQPEEGYAWARRVQRRHPRRPWNDDHPYTVAEDGHRRKMRRFGYDSNEDDSPSNEGATCPLPELSPTDDLDIDFCQENASASGNLAVVADNDDQDDDYGYAHSDRNCNDKISNDNRDNNVDTFTSDVFPQEY